VTSVATKRVPIEAQKRLRTLMREHFLERGGVQCEVVNKVLEGRPHVVDLLKNDEIHLIVNTTEGHQSIRDSAIIRRLALANKVCYTTTLTAGECYAIAIRHRREQRQEEVRTLQSFHSGSAGAGAP